jgi:hypothetical protein
MTAYFHGFGLFSFYKEIVMALKKTVKIFCVILLIVSPALSRVSLDDITTGATYRMTLTTGDVLEGVVDSKTDTTLILDCKGSAYTFAVTLVTEYELLSAPKKLSATTGAGNAPVESEILSYEACRQRQPGVNLKVTIKSGASFSGMLLSIDDENIKLDREGSVLPISRQVVDQIVTIPISKEPQTATPVALATTPVIFDTLIVKNPENNDYGAPKDTQAIVGTITMEDNTRISITRQDGRQDSYTFDQVIRTLRHTKGIPVEDQIERYAKTLFCPPDMVLADLPPGKATRPFFKVCIDKYEYPNKQSSVPQVNISYDNAKKLCEQMGKRLCTAAEWRWSCSGLEGYTYPYGFVLEKENCNMAGDRTVEPSGKRNKCISKFGAMDMTGNVFEWVTDNNGAMAAMGGPMSKCQTVSPGTGGDAKPALGLRCCKSN